MLVSIVVPTRNCSDTIAFLMDSIARLRGEYEVIVVDNSTDGTAEIVSRYPFVNLVKLNKRGLNLARNIGVIRAKGEIVAFTDGDCILPPDWVEKIVEALKDGAYMAVGGRVLLAPQLKGDFIAEYSERALIPIFVNHNREKVFSRDNFFNSFAWLRPPSGNNMAFLKAVIQEVGLFDERFHGGYDEIELEWRICQNGYRILYTPDLKVYHLHRSDVLRLLKQVHGYGRGHRRFLSKCKDPGFKRVTYAMVSGWILWTALLVVPLILTLTPLLTGLLTYTPLLMYLIHMMLYLARRCGFRSLIYPVLDILCYGSYMLGFLREALHKGS